jgi:peptidoglycan/xylan/chitin deacetylase (PgdA/CDA1 family)
MGKIDFFADDDNIVVNTPEENQKNIAQPKKTASDDEFVIYPTNNKQSAQPKNNYYSSPVKTNHKYNIMDVNDERKKKYDKYKKKQKKSLAVFASTLLFLLMCAIVIIAFLWINLGINKKDFSNYKKQASNQAKQLSSQNVELESRNVDLENQISDLVKENADLKKKAEEKARAAANQPVKASDKTVYLTFDDGPSENTPKILDILDQYGIKATFFVINNPKYNNYMKDIVARGHTIALHSYTHDYAKIYKSEKAYFKDLQKISDVVKEQTGVESKIARFPGGTSNTVSKRYCKGIMTKLKKSTAEKGYLYFDWNVDSTDASGNNVAVDKLIRYGTTGINTRNDTLVVLMHDTNAKDTTVEALPKIIQKYKDNGITKFAAITASTKQIIFNTNN